jgi:hypothetical protein
MPDKGRALLLNGLTFISGYPVKLKDYACTSIQDTLQDVDRDYVLFVGPKYIALIKVDSQDEEKTVLSWLLENIKSYESRPLEQNPTQKLLSIDTGRLVQEMQTVIYNHTSPYSYISSTDTLPIQTPL